MNNKFIPENWANAIQQDCVKLVKDNLGIDISEKEVDIQSPDFGTTLNLIVRAMKI